MFGFLDAARRTDWKRAATYLHSNAGNAPDQARQLKRVLDRKLLQDPGTLSVVPEGRINDGLAPNVESIGPVDLNGHSFEITLERVSQNGQQIWLFSTATMSMLPQLYASIGDTELEERLPEPLVQHTLFDAPLWQWLALIVFGAIAYVIAKSVQPLLAMLARLLLRRVSTHVEEHLIVRIAKPLSFLLGVALFRLAVEWIVFPLLIRIVLMRVLLALLFGGLAWTGLRVIDAIAAEFIVVMSQRQRASAASVVPLLRRTAKVLAVVISVLLTLNFWGFNTTALLAGLGVGGLAVALAAQKTIENLFGGVSIISDKPVLVGDFCKFGDRSGTVEDIGLRSTRVRTSERTIVTVPNGQFSSLMIENFGPRDKILFNPTLKLRRDIKPSQIRSVIERIAEMLKANTKVDPNQRRVRFVGMGDQSVNIEVNTYILTRNFDEYLEVQEQLLLGFLDLLENVGTGLAVPTQITLVQPVSPPAEPAD